MIVIEEQPQVEVLFLIQPTEAVVERLGNVCGLLGRTIKHHAGVRVHAVPGGRERSRRRVDHGWKVPTAGLAVQLIYDLVSSIKDHTGAMAYYRTICAPPARPPFPCCFWLVDARGRRIRRGQVKLGGGSTRSANKVSRTTPALAGFPALEI